MTFGQGEWIALGVGSLALSLLGLILIVFEMWPVLITFLVTVLAAAFSLWRLERKNSGGTSRASSER